MTASVTARTAVNLLRVLPRERLTRLVGKITEAQVPQPLLRPILALYSRAYNVALDEAIVPAEGFQSFNQFFTRQLRPGVHTVTQDPAGVVSPADGRLEDQGALDDHSAFRVKGQRYDATSLLGSETEAQRYRGGWFSVVYLSPRDYHRVHSPVEGRVSMARHLPGTLFPVNALGIQHVPQLFARNERVVVEINSPFGPVAVVFVGAFVVGKISLAFDGPPRPPHGGPVIERRYQDGEAPVLTRGADLGAFLLGSTVVLLLPPREGSPGRWSPGEAEVPGPIRMGQVLARWSAS
jgi:phosphatidylserine decarboxylase